jgi:hypothetical protein
MMFTRKYISKTLQTNQNEPEYFCRVDSCMLNYKLYTHQHLCTYISTCVHIYDILIYVYVYLKISYKIYINRHI